MPDPADDADPVFVCCGGVGIRDGLAWERKTVLHH